MDVVKQQTFLRFLTLSLFLLNQSVPSQLRIKNYVHLTSTISINRFKQHLTDLNNYNEIKIGGSDLFRKIQRGRPTFMYF